MRFPQSKGALPGSGSERTRTLTVSMNENETSWVHSLVNEAFGELENDGNEARAPKAALRALRTALGWYEAPSE